MADIVLADVASVVQTDHHWLPKHTSEILAETTQFMGKSGSYAYYADGMVSITNNLIVELWGINNAARKKNLKPKFTEYPVITTMEDILPFEYEVIFGVFVYGLGYWLFMQDEEYLKANAMLAQFNAMKSKFAPALYTKVESIV